MQTIIKPASLIQQNYEEISQLCKKEKEPVFLTKAGHGDLVVMDIDVYDQRERRLELREKLLEVNEMRQVENTNQSADAISNHLHKIIGEKLLYV